MDVLTKLENKFGKYSLDNLTGILIGGQILCYLYVMMIPHSEAALSLVFARVLEGEWWRMFTFVFLPIDKSPIFAVFTWYIYYLYGSMLERVWGAFRYNLFIFIGIIAILVGSVLFPADIMTNIYIYTSIFLAFAYLFPDFTLLLFFIIPVKVKWLSYLVWAGLIITFLFGNAANKILTLLSIGNYLLFFGGKIFSGLILKAGKISNSAVMTQQNPSYMTCAVCGSTERDKKIFYYCHDCNPSICYCEDHIKNHKHQIVN